jgi:CheY-like chemotaxis protein/Tfp pilus assembly protein PilZ
MNHAIGDAMTESREAIGAPTQHTGACVDFGRDVSTRPASDDPASTADEELSIPVRLLLSALIECVKDRSPNTLRTALSAVERHLDRLTPEVVELIARARTRTSDGADSARALEYAAERWRLTGEWSRAVELCQLAHDASPTSPQLHRTWGLALLGIGDAEGARGHLERWREEHEDELDARIWSIEALWSCGRLADASREVRSLAGMLDIRIVGDGAATELRRAVEEHLQRAEDPLVPRRANPFWRASTLLERHGAERCSQRESRDLQPAGALPREIGPLALLAEDVPIAGIPLSNTLEKARCKVVVCKQGVSVVATGNLCTRKPDLIIVPVQPSDSSELDRIRQIRESSRLRDTPILAVVESHGSPQNRRSLQALGVVGFVDRRTAPAHVMFRVNRIVHGTRGRRLHARAPAFFPLTLEVAGRAATEYALSLSIGGMAVTSERPLDLNSHVQLRFRLEDGGNPLNVPGRVVYCRSGPDCAPLNEIGIVFVAPDPGSRSRIEREVSRLLDR